MIDTSYKFQFFSLKDVNGEFLREMFAIIPGYTVKAALAGSLVPKAVHSVPRAFEYQRAVNEGKFRLIRANRTTMLSQIQKARDESYEYGILLCTVDGEQALDWVNAIRKAVVKLDEAEVLCAEMTADARGPINEDERTVLILVFRFGEPRESRRPSFSTIRHIAEEVYLSQRGFLSIQQIMYALKIALRPVRGDLPAWTWYTGAKANRNVNGPDIGR